MENDPEQRETDIIEPAGGELVESESTRNEPAKIDIPDGEAERRETARKETARREAIRSESDMIAINSTQFKGLYSEERIQILKNNYMRYEMHTANVRHVTLRLSIDDTAMLYCCYLLRRNTFNGESPDNSFAIAIATLIVRYGVASAHDAIGIFRITSLELIV
jgi:hypothetical protein